jgi:hypothetical protein
VRETGRVTSEQSGTARHGTRSVEIERKYDLDADVGTPVFVGIGPVAAVSTPEVRDLDARYFDTVDFALARAHVAVRRREGGPDAGWHVKRDAAEGRVEQHWPLDAASAGARAEGGDTDGAAEDAAFATALPAGARDAVRDLIGDAGLRPVARVRNHRIVTLLLDADGAPLAEFCDDHVTASNLLTGGGEVWREWEVELAPAAGSTPFEREALLDVLERAVFAAGGRPAVASSKLGRALQA